MPNITKDIRIKTLFFFSLLSLLSPHPLPQYIDNSSVDQITQFPSKHNWQWVNKHDAIASPRLCLAVTGQISRLRKSKLHHCSQQPWFQTSLPFDCHVTIHTMGYLWWGSNTQNRRGEGGGFQREKKGRSLSHLWTRRSWLHSRRPEECPLHDKSAGKGLFLTAREETWGPPNASPPLESPLCQQWHHGSQANKLNR